MVASHTAVPLGTANQRSLFALARESKWLVWRTPPHKTLPLGKGQKPPVSPTQGQAVIIRGNPIPAISKHLTAFLYGWLPLSDAAGILFHYNINPIAYGIYPLRFPCNTTQHNAYAYHIPSPESFHIDDCKSPTMGEQILLKRLANCPATINSGCIDPRMASRQ